MTLPQKVQAVVEDRARLAAVSTYASDVQPIQRDLDALSRLAAAAFNVPIALVSVVMDKRQVFKARLGLEESETPIDISFCAHALADPRNVLVVPDATLDERFAHNPLVTGPHQLRFYAGMPIVVADQPIGTLCVLDRKAHEPGNHDLPDGAIGQLRDLAALAGRLLALEEDRRVGHVTRAALHHEEKRRAVAIEAAALSSWAWNGGRFDAIECDDTLPGLLGLPGDRSLAVRSIIHALDPRDVRAAKASFRKALLHDGDFIGECRVRGTNPPRWLSARGRVVERDRSGRALTMVGVAYDISERRLAEERQHLFLRELNHRVKNTLATIQALASQTVRHAKQPTEFLHSFSARLQALGRAHGLLSDREWRDVSLDDVVAREIAPFDTVATPRVRTHGVPVSLTPDQALGLSMILHELGSNALLHGSLSVPGGSVDLSWHILGSRSDRRLELQWVEKGGPAVSPPSAQGFGTILIRRSLGKVLNSNVELRFDPTGVVAHITMPVM